jgi:3-oxocholest-4-en-26-oate---CoA ligase
VNENYASIYEAIADAMPDAVALVQGERRVAWRELDERAARLAAHFAKAGLKPGDRVAIVLWNSIDYVEALIGIAKARLTPVNINYRSSANELRYLLEKSHAKGIVFHRSVGAPVAEAAAGLECLVAVEDGSGAPLPPGSTDYTAAIAAVAAAPRIERGGDDQFIVFTGGTTGMPKAVLWRHSILVSLLARNAASPATTPQEIVVRAASARRDGSAPISFILPPLMHSTGLLGTLGALAQGGTVIFSASRSLDPDLVWRETKRERAKGMTIVGDVFARPLLDALRRLDPTEARASTASLKTMQSVGVRWSADVKENLLAFGDMALIDVLASSEGGPVARSETTKSNKQVISKFELIPGTWLMDENGERVPLNSGRIGMLVSAGILPDGYLGEAGDGTSGTFRVIEGKRYVVTGDWARAETDGTITLIGRGSSVINTGGEKVYADEVEKVIAAHPAVADVIVAGVPDPRWGHVIGAVVAIRPGAAIHEDELVAHVGAQLAGYKKPRKVRFVDSIQRKATGKADRQWATELLASSG